MKLSIAESLYLIALDDEEGRILSSAEKTIVPGVVSSSILEMMANKKLKFDNNKILVLDSSVNSGNYIVDLVASKLKNGDDFVNQITNISAALKDIEEALNNVLVQRGILKKEATKLLWIPLSERMDNLNYAYEEEIRTSMREIVLKNRKPTSQELILLNLIFNCDILYEIFQTQDELIDAEKRTKDLFNEPGHDPDILKALYALRLYFKK